MSIQKRSLALFNDGHFKKRVTLRHEHIISFSCNGYLSYDNRVIVVVPNIAIHLPKNIAINIFLHGELNEKITIYKYISETSKSSNILLTNYINAIEEIKRKKLIHHDIIINSISNKIKEEIRVNLEKKHNNEDIERKIEQIILAEPRKIVSTNDICKKTNMSKSKLYRKLKERNITLKDFILNIKINHAKTLLINSNLLINEIAFECGFDSSSYFSNRFKLRTGMSPTYFRENRTRLKN